MEPVVDDYLMAAVTKAGGLDKHHPVTGLYQTLVLRDLKDREEADEWRKALYRCAHWMSRNGVAPVSVSVKIERDGQGYLIRYSVYHKVMARLHILNKHGKDRSKWPYDPRRRNAE
jgi:hypothetical protein